MKIRKILIFSLCVAVTIAILTVTVAAKEDDGELTMPDEYNDFLGSLPQNIIDSLPNGMISGNAEDVSESVRKMSSPTELLRLLLDGIFGGIGSVTPTLVIAIGILLLSRVIELIAPPKEIFGSLSTVSRLCVMSVVLNLVFLSISRLSEYFTSLCGIAKAYIPLSAALYAAGGNVSTAAASSASFGVCLTVCQFIFTYTAIPMFVFCTSMAVLSSFEGASIVNSITGGIKRYYTVILSIVMSALGVGIGAQTVISAKADDASMRGAKIAIGSFVPISGGALSSSLGAIASGVELIRASVGMGGVIIIFMLLIPLISHLAVMKLFFFILDLFSAATGDRVGVISEMGELYSYLLGIACISSGVFILMFAILGLSAAAIR